MLWLGLGTKNNWYVFGNDPVLACFVTANTAEDVTMPHQKYPAFLAQPKRSRL